MHRSNSGSRFTDRAQHGSSSYPSTPLAAEVRSTFNSKDAVESIQARVNAAIDRLRSWNDLTESEKKTRKRK